MGLRSLCAVGRALARSALQQPCLASLERSPLWQAHTVQGCWLAARCSSSAAGPEGAGGADGAARPAAADSSDPTGIWRYELNSERIADSVEDVRTHLEDRACKALVKALEDVPLTREAIDALLVLTLTGDGTQLRMVESSAHLLGQADLGALAQIVTHSVSTAWPAFTDLLHQKQLEQDFNTWHSIVSGSSEQLGEVEDCPPRLANEHAREAGEKQLADDLQSALRTCSHIAKFMSTGEFAGELAPYSATPVDGDKVAEQRASELMRLGHAAPSAQLLVEQLSPEDLELVLSLRTGRRRWRFNLRDWDALSRALVNGAPKSLRIDLAPGIRDSSSPDTVQTVCLTVLLRGQMIADRKTTRDNVHLHRLLEQNVLALPEADVDMLIRKWNTLSTSTASRVVHRVLRYARLNPEQVPVRPDGEGVPWMSVATAPTRPVEEPERVAAFVRAEMLQVLKDRLPASWTAWQARVGANVARMHEAHLRALADVLSLPRSLHEAALTNAVVALVKPEELFGAYGVQYMGKVREVWKAAGHKVDDTDEQLIVTLVPRILDKLANEYHCSEGESTRMLDITVVSQIAMSLGELDTVELNRLTQTLQTLSRKAVQDTVRTATEGLLRRLGMTLEQVHAQLKDLATEDTSKASTSVVQGVIEDKMAEQQLSHMDSFMPAGFMPPKILDLGETSAAQWGDGYHELLVRLVSQLSDDQLDCDVSDFPTARLLYMLADELNLLEPQSNTPHLIKYLLDQVPMSSMDSYLLPAASGSSEPDDEAHSSPRSIYRLVNRAVLEAVQQHPELLQELATAEESLTDMNHMMAEAAGEAVEEDELEGADEEQGGVAGEEEGVVEEPKGGREARGVAESVEAAAGAATGAPEMLSEEAGKGEGDEVDEGDMDGWEEDLIEGCSVNTITRLLILAEAQKVVAKGGLVWPVAAAVHWAWEHTAPNVMVSLLYKWGDMDYDETVPLELAYACARLGRRDEGLRESCKILNFQQRLELAHIICGRRLQEAGRLGDGYMPRRQRVEMSVRRAEKLLKAAKGDVELALSPLVGKEGRRHFLGQALDLLPNCAACVNYHMGNAEQIEEDVACGGSVVTELVRNDLLNNSDPAMARLDRTGAISSKLLLAGPSLLLPDLIQNIADRPLEEVLNFFERLQALPRNPNMEAVRDVFGWYQDGFLDGLDYEQDPVAAWQKFEREYCTDSVELTDLDGNRFRGFLPDGNPPDFQKLLSEQEREAEAAAMMLPPAAAADDGAVATVGDGERPLRPGYTPPKVRDIEVDEKGRALATGRRKACNARVWLTYGVGDVFVNGQPMGRYFPKMSHRGVVLEPLTALRHPKGYTIDVKVTGGGSSCQAQAARLGIAKALVRFDPSVHGTLKKLGLLRRDPRRVEPKKPARKKARKKRQWVKR